MSRRPADYLVQIYHRAESYRCACGDCGWSGDVAALDTIEDCSLTPGDASPAGRCPECGTLAYPDEPQDHQKAAARAMLAALTAVWAESDGGWRREEPTAKIVKAAIAAAEAAGITTEGR